METSLEGESIMEDEEYYHQCYLEEMGYYRQQEEHQQDIEDAPLFFWKETCNYYLNHDTTQAMKTVTK